MNPLSRETVARQYGTDHTVLYDEDVGPEELLELLGRLDEPFCDPAFVPTYSLSAMTKRHVKVALSGDGGDEVFGGYPKYLYGENGHFRLPFSSWLPPLLRKTAVETTRDGPNLLENARALRTNSVRMGALWRFSSVSQGFTAIVTDRLP